MPLAKRVVSPVRLNRKQFSVDNKLIDFTVVNNNTLVCVLKQLSSLSFLADELFSELSQECISVLRRTDNLTNKIKSVEEKIDDLDFRTVKIPVGDLKTYKEVSHHLKTEYGLDSLLFSPASRPDCIIDLYDLSLVSPVNTIRQCNAFRRDGRTGSKLFSLTPVVKDDALYGVESVVDIAVPLHYGDFERKPREPKSIKKRPQSLATLTELENYAQMEQAARSSGALDGAHLVSPCSPGDVGGELRESKSASGIDLVPIDVTGSSFVRMCEYRESIRSTSREYMEETGTGPPRRRRKHRRRQTLSSDLLPEQPNTNYGHGFCQSHDDIRPRSVSRERLERPKSMAYLSRYAPRGENCQKSREELHRDRVAVETERDERSRLARSCSLRRSMRSLFKNADKEKSKSTDLWVRGRPRSPGPPTVEIDYPLRRSKSLPRSLKSISKSLSRLIYSRSASTEGRLDTKHEYHEDEQEVLMRRGSLGATRKQPMASSTPQCLDQGYVTVVAKPRKQKGFRKSLTQRMSRSQSQMNSLSSSSTVISSPNSPPKHHISSNKPDGYRNNKKQRDTRRKSGSGNIDRPKSLEFGAVPTVAMTPRGNRHSIPVCTPTTPSSGDHVFTPTDSGAPVGIKHRMNIPPGQAWKAFGGIRYRGSPNAGTPNGHSDTRQSSSEEIVASEEIKTEGHWTASSGSTRYSTESGESEYPQSTSSHEPTSEISQDRDSAISFHMYGHDRLNSTTDNNHDDDASTLNGDISLSSAINDDVSTIHEDGDSDSTLNGSVVNAEDNSKHSDQWINSLSRTKDTKEMKDRRKRRRSRKDRDKKSLTDSPGSLTMNNVRAHDYAQTTRNSNNIRMRRSTGDESSIYSQDTDGFYTSMHIDSGLKAAAALEGDSLNSSGLTPMSALFRSTSLQHHYPPNTMAGTTVPIVLHSKNTQKTGSKDSGAKSGRKLPPPPPPRGSTLGDRDHRLFPSPPSSSVQDDEIDRLITAASNFSLNSNDSSGNKRHSGSLTRLSQGYNASHINDSIVSESDPEMIYTRVKDKSRISAAGIPSLCSVTPLPTDDEDADLMLETSGEWRSGDNSVRSDNLTPTNQLNQLQLSEWRSRDNSIRSDNITPTNHTTHNQLQLRLPSSTPLSSRLQQHHNPSTVSRATISLHERYKFNPILETSRESSSGAERSLDESGLSLEMDISGMDLIDTSIYSTWPRNPSNKPTDNEDGYKGQNDYENIDNIHHHPNIIIANDNENTPTSAQQATYVRSLRLFNVGSLEELPTTRDVLPEVKTPDGILDGGSKRAISKFSNTFQIPTDHKFTFDVSSICVLNSSDEVGDTSITPTKGSADVNNTSLSQSPVKSAAVVSAKPPILKKSTSMDTADYTATWPRKHKKGSGNNSKDGVSSPKFIDDSEIDSSSMNMYEMDEKSWTNSFPRKKKQMNFAANRSRTIDVPRSLDFDEVSDNNNTSLPVGDKSIDLDQSLPIAAPATLIISSPVSSQAAYVDNPHKRSLCSPVSNKEFAGFSQDVPVSGINSTSATVSPGNTLQRSVKKSTTMFEFSNLPVISVEESSSKDDEAIGKGSAFRPVSKPLYPSLGAMKHSISFPETTKKQQTVSNSKTDTYNRSWYDNNSPYKTNKQTDIQINEDKLQQSGYPFAAFLNDSFLSTLETSSGYDSKRQSVISNNSTNSSGSGKKSVTFATDLKTSQSSLNKSENGSVGSNEQHVGSSNRRSTTLGGLFSSFKKKSLESLKSSDSGKSSKSNDGNSVRLRNGKTIEVTLPEPGSNTSRSPRDSQISNTSLKSALAKTWSRSSSVGTRSLLGSPDRRGGAHSPEKASFTSPTHLKRSSALLDEDFDVMSYANAGAPVKPSRPSPERELPSATTNKRQCKPPTETTSPTGPVILSPRHKTTGKIIVAKKTRLKRANSKSSIHNSRTTVVVNAESCEVVTMPVCSPVQSSDMDYSKTSPLFAENPFSSIIMDSAPSKVSVTTPFDFRQAISSYNRKDNGNVTLSSDLNSQKVVPVVSPGFTAKTSKILTVNNNNVGKSSTGVVINLQNTDLTNTKSSSEAATKQIIPPSANSTKTTPVKTGEGTKILSSFSPTKSPIKSRVLTNKANDLNSKLPVSSTSRIPESSSHKVTKTLSNSGNSGSISKSAIKSPPSAFDSLIGDNKDTVVVKPAPPKFVLPKLRPYKSASDTSSASLTGSVEKALRDSTERKPALKLSLVKNADKDLSLDKNNRKSLSPDVRKDNLDKTSSRMNSGYPFSGSTSSLNVAGGSLSQSNVLTKSLSNLSCLSLLRTESNFSLSHSSYSLARSNDSLASSSSITEKNRAAKLAFLDNYGSLENLDEQVETSNDNSADCLNGKFAKYTIGLKKLSESKTSLNSYNMSSDTNTVKRSDKSSLRSDKNCDKENSAKTIANDKDSAKVLTNGKVPLVNGDVDNKLSDKNSNEKFKLSSVSNKSNIPIVNGDINIMDNNENSIENSKLANVTASRYKSKLPVFQSTQKSGKTVLSPESSGLQGRNVKSLLEKFQK